MPVRDEIKAKLSEVRGGRTLGEGLVALIVEYLVDEAEVTSADQVDIKDMKSIATEAWANKKDGGELPGIHSKAIAAWITAKPLPATFSSSRSVDGGGDDLDDDVDDSQLLGVDNPSAHDLAKLEEDKNAQGLSGTRLLVLSASIELGRVPPPANVLGSVAYKSDPRLSDLAKQQRKAGMLTLSKILDGSNVRRDCQTHFANLIRDFSDLGCIREASRLTSWWSETQTVSSDDKVLSEYIKEYLRKYSGRGLPEVLDVVLATRVTGQRAAGGVSSDQLKEVLGVAKAAKSEVADLKRELNSLKSEIGRLRNSRNGGPSGDPKGPKCHKCGEFGHIARDCPNKSKKTSEDDDSEDKRDSE